MISANTLQQISTSLSLVVAVSFWYFIHDPINFQSINQHGVTALFNTLDLFLAANEIHFVKTVYKPFIVAIMYVILSLILAFSLNKKVYAALDWKEKPGATTINMIVCLTLLIIIHGLLCIAKKWILNKFMHGKTNPNVEKHHIHEIAPKPHESEEFEEDLMEDGTLHVNTTSDHAVYGNLNTSDIEMQVIPL